MLLITVSEWLGPNRQVMDNPAKFGKPESSTTLQGYVTNLPLNTALERLDNYRVAYNDWSSTLSLCFSLVYVSGIEALTDVNIANMSLELIETLSQTKEDFE